VAVAEHHRPKRLDVPLRYGSALYLAFRVIDSDGTAVDITGWSVAGQVSEIDGAGVAVSTEVVTTPDNVQRIVLRATAADLAAITWAGLYEITRTDVDLYLVWGQIDVRGNA